MLSIFKVKKIEKELKNIQENTNIDFEKGESFVLDKEASELEKNVYLFTASSQEKRQTIVFRLEITSTQSNVWVYYVEGYNRYCLEQTEYTTSCPLKIIRDQGVWSVSFAGHLKKNNNKDLVRITFSGKFTSNEEMIDSIKYMNMNQYSKILSKEKEQDDFYKILKNKGYQEYHQFGKIKGKIIVEGQHTQIDLPCYRRHTFGKLDWSTINNHFKVIACNKQNYYLFEMKSLPSIPYMECGIAKENNEKAKSSLKNKYERQLMLKGSSPENLNLLFELENDEKVGIHYKKIDEKKYVLQEGEYTFIIGVAEFLINGINYRGIYELGYNKDRNRWFNNKDVSKFN